MSFKEKIKDYRQRQEAKAYFNRNNTFKFSNVDYLITFAITVAIGSIGLVVLTYVTGMIGFNFSIMYVALGYAGARGVLKFKGNGGNDIAGAIGALGMFVGMVFGEGLYIATILGSFGANVSLLDLGLYLTSVQSLFTSNLIQSVFCILSIFTTFYLIRNN